MIKYLLAILLLASCGGASVEANNVTPLPKAKLTVSETSTEGGLRGNVNTTLLGYRYVKPGTTSFEWAGLFVLDNHASEGENVGLYSQGNAYSSGPTWALVSEVIERARSTASLVGHEINVKTLTADIAGNRVGLHIVESGVSSTDAIRVSGNWRNLLSIPERMLKPASGRHVGNIPISIDGRLYYIPLYQ